MNVTKRVYRILVCFACLFIVACDGAEDNEMSSVDKDHYTIKTGGVSFLIPSDYLVDETNRIEASEVAKIKVPPNNRDSRYTPHKYVILMALLPDLRAVENGRFYRKGPARTADSIQFNLDYNSGAYQGKIKHAKANADPEHFNVDDLSKYKDGWIFGGKKSSVDWDMYFHVKNGRLVGYLNCSPSAPNPACNGSYIYSDHINLDVNFSIENFDWFTKENGIQKIFDLLDSWRIHSEEDKEL